MSFIKSQKFSLFLTMLCIVSICIFTSIVFWGNPSIGTAEEIPVDTEAPAWANGTMLVSNVAYTSMTLTWAGATDNQGVTGYNVYNGNDVIATATGTSCKITGLSSGTTYTLTVQAVDAAGNISTTGPSATATTNTAPDITAPTWPEGSSLTYSDLTQTSVTLSWNQATDNKGITGYRIYLVNRGNRVAIATLTDVDPFTGIIDPTYEITGLVAGAGYTYAVEACDAANNWSTGGPAVSIFTPVATGDGGGSTSTGGLTVTLTDPDANVASTSDTQVVGEIGFSIDPDNVHFTWDFSNGLDDGTGVNLKSNLELITLVDLTDNTQVVLDLGEDDDYLTGEDVLTVGDFQYTKSASPKLRRLELILKSTSLTPGHSYSITFGRSFMANNGSTLGKSYVWMFEATPIDRVAPSWSEGSALTCTKVGPNSLLLNWTAAEDNTAVTSYNVYQDDILIATLSGAKLSYAVSGLNAGQTYGFKVEAADNSGNLTETPLTVSQVTLLADNDAPTWPAESTISASNILTDNLDLNWTAADDNVGVDGYRIYNYDAVAQSESLLGTVGCDTLTYHIMGLTPANGYVFHVKAVDGAGNVGAALESAEITTAEGTADTEAPTWASNAGMSSSLVDWDVTISWSGASDNVGIRGYNLYENGVFLATVGAGTSKYDTTMVADASWHSFAVEAFDAAGNVSERKSIGAYSRSSDPGDIQRPTWQDGTVLYATDITAHSFTLNLTEAPVDNVGVFSYDIWIGTSEDNLVQYTSWDACSDGEPVLSHTITCVPHPGDYTIMANTTYVIQIHVYDTVGNRSDALQLTLTTPAEGETVPATSMAGSSFSFDITTAGNTYYPQFVSVDGNYIYSKFTETVDPNNYNINFRFANKYLQPNRTTFWTDIVQMITLAPADDPTNIVDILNQANTYTPNETSATITRNLVVTNYNQTLSLEPNTEYILTVHKGSWDISKNSRNKYVLNYTYVCTFTTTGGDLEAPAWDAGAELTATKLAPLSLTLNWPAATDNVGVTGYQIYQNDTLLGSVDSDTLTYDVSGLTAGTEYNFTVQAGDKGNNWSTEGLSLTQTMPAADTEAPVWPEGSDLTASDITPVSLMLNWTAATDNYEVKGYKIYQDGVEVASAGKLATSALISGLTKDTSYTFSVAAVDESDNLSINNPQLTQATTPDTTAPTWPESSSLTINKDDSVKSDMITLYWTQAVDDVEVAEYTIYQNGVEVGTTTCVTATIFDVINLEPETEYTFKVEARDADGNISTTGPELVQWTAAEDPVIKAGRQIAAGNDFTLVLKNDGTVWAWGDNGYGQLGTGNNIDSSVPVPVVGLHDIVAIDAGYRFGVALAADGTVWVWGENQSGIFGNGGDGHSLNMSSSPSCYTRTLPIQMPGVDHVVAVSAGMYGIAFMKDDGTIWATGVGPFGTSGGLNSQVSYAVPTQLPDLTGVVQLRDCYQGLTVIRSDKTAWKMTDGINWVQVEGSGYVGISSGGTTGWKGSFIYKADGTLYYYSETDGLMGYYDTVSDVVAADTADTAVYVKNDGTVWTWGSGVFGNLGYYFDLSMGETLSPPGQQVTALDGIKIVDAVAASSPFVVALADDGTMYSWGCNWQGQLGVGTDDYNSNYNPVQVLFNTEPTMDMTYACLSGDGTQIKVMFDQKVADPSNDLSSFAVSVDGEDVAVTAIAVDPDDPYQLLLTMAAPITRGSAVSMTYVSGTIKAVGGEALSAFTNYAVSNHIAASVYYQTPSANADDVAVDTSVQVSFNKYMNADSINSDTVLLKNGDTVIPASVTYTSSRKYLTLTPEALLDYGTTYTVILTDNILDVDSLNIEAYSFSFTTTSLISSFAPNSKTVTPSGIAVDADLVVGFTEAIDTATFSNNDIYLQKLDANGDPVDGSTITTSGSLSENGKYLTVHPDAIFDYASQYRLVLPATMADINGLVIGDDGNTVDFNTQPCQLADTATMTQNGTKCNSLTANEFYKFSAVINNLSTVDQDLKVRIVVRGGRGAREDHGGTILANSLVRSDGSTTFVTVAANGSLTVSLPEISFTDDIVGNIYVDVYVWDSNGLYQAAKPVHYQFPVYGSY